MFAVVGGCRSDRRVEAGIPAHFEFNRRSPDAENLSHARDERMEDEEVGDVRPAVVGEQHGLFDCTKERLFAVVMFWSVTWPSDMYPLAGQTLFGGRQSCLERGPKIGHTHLDQLHI